MCGVMSMKYKITPLCLGHIQRPKTNMIYQCGDSAIQDFPLIAFYLENDEHKIMVDTGGTAPDGKNGCLTRDQIMKVWRRSLLRSG